MSWLDECMDAVNVSTWRTFEYQKACIDRLMADPPYSVGDPMREFWPTCCHGGWHLNPDIANLLTGPDADDRDDPLLIAWYRDPGTRDWRTLRIALPYLVAFVGDDDVPAWATRSGDAR
ncbi:MAG: hypothetical protein KF817_02865 [Phycisphaeraceae bacterium]|nr:hypothetical protein [Phycisphaeraceae bacterium]